MPAYPTDADTSPSAPIVEVGQAGNPEWAQGPNDTATGAISLGAALLSVSQEEPRPKMSGLSLFAMQQRQIHALQAEVAKLKAAI